MSIIEMIDAIDYAYNVALVTEATDIFAFLVVRAVHRACKIDAENRCDEADYLLLTPAELEKLFESVRGTILITYSLDLREGRRVTRQLLKKFKLED